MSPSTWLRRAATIAAVWCAAIAGALAQSPGPPLDPWMADRDPAFVRVASTPPTSVIVQSVEGFLWIGTQTGLARWDGYRLKNYVADAARDGALPDSFINALLVDAAGRLWIGMSGGGLVRYDAARDRFEPAFAAGQALSHNSVYALAVDAQGRLLVGTGRGVDLVDPAAGTVRRHADFAHTRGLPDAQATSVLVDRDAGLWVGTRLGLFRGEVSGGAFVAVPLPVGDALAVVINNLVQDSAGRVWITTRSHGVFVAESGRDPVPLKDFVGPDDALDRPGVHALVEATPGEVWIGTDGGGIVRVDTARRRVVGVVRHGRESASLPDDEVFAMLRDRSGLVWIASDTALSFTARDHPGLATWWGGAGTSHGITDRNVPHLIALPDGRVWLGSGSGGIDILDPARRRVAHLRPSSKPTPTALPPGRVLTLLALPDGDVLVGTQLGLYRTGPDGRNATRLNITGRPPTAATWALALHAGRLWVGGLDGLWGVDPGAKGPLPVLSRLAPERMREPRVAALLPDGDHLWVGTRAGLLRVDTTTMQALPGLDTRDDPALERSLVPSLLKDTRGRLWIGLFGGGVRVVEFDAAGRPATVHRIGTAQGLPQDSVDALVDDEDGDVWVSTDEGIARVARDTLEVRAFGTADGIGAQQHWTSAAARTADGHLLFGGAGGLTIVDPRRVQRWTYRAPIAITELRLGDAPSVAGVAASAAPLTVPLSRRSVLVEFAALDYSQPGRNRYAYRLLGAESEWTPTEPTRRLAAYTNLAPGSYVLQLRGSNRAGVWSEPLELALNVPAAWHETGWFRGALVATAVLLVLALMQVRTLYLRRRQRALEALVAQRTAALEDSQRQLEQMAYNDGLTGLANCRWFNDERQRLIALQQRRGGGCGLVLIDLDHFKQVNDTHGHDAGDAVLVAVAERLKHAVRETDTLARLGGDEFAAMLPDLQSDEALHVVCERILQAMAAPLVWGGVVLPLGASVGAACYPRDGQDVESLYKAADIALYDAKRAGRNRWRLRSGPDSQPAPPAHAPA